MSWIYSQTDYQGYVDDNYRRYPFFSQRAELIDARFAADYRNQIVIVAGGGYGYLIDELSNRQWNRVYSLDASSWAIEEGARQMPTRASRILLADMLSASDMQSLRSDVGRPWFTITEDVLPCAADAAEAQTMLTNLRDLTRPSGTMMHIITPRVEGGVLQPDGSVQYPNGGQVQMPGFLWLTKDEWLTLIGPGEPVLFTGEYVWRNV